MVRILHNPRCGKSRQTLQLLLDKGLRPDIVEYLKTPLNQADLTAILAMLGKQPRELMRRQEAVYRELNLQDQKLSREQLIQALVDHPILIERPIVIHQGKAAIGRPPEAVLAIL